MASNQILTVEQMQAAEQALIDAGESVESLMERAGAGAADWVWRLAAGRPVTVLCGPGNNGGDGYVIARVLAERGLAVSVVAPIDPATDAAKAARQAWGGQPVDHAYGGVFVDCLFGSGLSRPLSDDLQALLLDLLNSHDLRVSVDLPSGVDSDSGEPLGAGLPQYDLTVALGAWKFAHWSMPGAGAMGAVRLVDIGVAAVQGAAQVSERPRLFPPAANAHKYTRGLLAVIGGEMPGAAMLASRAALHGGAGYVKLLAAHKTPAAPDEIVLDERPLAEALEDRRIAALLVGPGLGRSNEAEERLAAALAHDLPSVVDADGLILLTPDMLLDRSAPLILTPHAGELNSLLDTFGIASGADALARLADVTKAIVVAKGPYTHIAAPGGRLEIAPRASSWLSTAGTGDVLAGLVASRLATGSKPFHAASEAVWLHSEAARKASPGFSASELLQFISDAYKALM